MATCNVYKHPMLLGAGSITNGATSITGFTAATGATVGSGRNVGVLITSSTDAGKSFFVKVVTDGGTTLTIGLPNPYAT